MFGLTGSSTASDFKPHYFSPRVIQYKQRTLPKIVISREAYAKMWLYVDIAQEEVGWMGTAEQTPDGDFFIDRVWLLKQEVTGTETEMSNEGLSELATELLNRGDEGMKDWDNLRFWGHSHVRMGTSPSGTDQRTMMMLEEAQHPWFIRGILNKLGRIEFTLFLYEENLVIEDCKWTVEKLPAGAKPVEQEPAKSAAVDSKGEATAADGKTEGQANATTSGGTQQVRYFGAPGYNDPLYKPELAASLRKEVEKEFKAKVTSRSWSWAPWKRKPPTETEGQTEAGAPSEVDAGAEGGAAQQTVQASQPAPESDRPTGDAKNSGDKA